MHLIAKWPVRRRPSRWSLFRYWSTLLPDGIGSASNWSAILDYLADESVDFKDISDLWPRATRLTDLIGLGKIQCRESRSRPRCLAIGNAVGAQSDCSGSMPWLTNRKSRGRGHHFCCDKWIRFFSLLWWTVNRFWASTVDASPYSYFGGDAAVTLEPGVLMETKFGAA